MEWLNCVANGKNRKNFDNIWVQPASGDAGGSIGAALAYWFLEEKERFIDPNDDMQGSYLGPEYSNNQIELELSKLGAVYSKISNDDLVELHNDLANDKAVGWFQGRMEFGPRALGSRSILGNPKMQKTKKFKFKVKFRESFRPFALQF